MQPNELYRRYQDLQRYVGWTEDDARRTRVAGELLKPHFPSLVADFYAEIERHPEARKVITGGQQQIDRLQGTLIQWLGELLSGQYDQDYVMRRWRVGWRHMEIGLNQIYTNVALSRLRGGMLVLLLILSRVTNSRRALPARFPTVPLRPTSPAKRQRAVAAQHPCDKIRRAPNTHAACRPCCGNTVEDTCPKCYRPIRSGPDQRSSLQRV